MSRNSRLFSLLSPVLRAPIPRLPSKTIMAGAMSGLLGIAAVNCDDSGSKNEPDPIRRDAGGEMCVCPPVGDASVAPDTMSMMPDARGGDAMSTTDGASHMGPVITSEVEGNRTYAEIIRTCEARGGYTQLHAACAGVNSCAGFSYGDWNPGVTIEHTCAGVNGCNGMSCVVLPPDGGKTGKEVYEAQLPENGPRSCTNCHGGYDHVTHVVDPTKFKVYFMPGEQTSPNGRTMLNWKEKRSAAAQANIVAFGSMGILPDGTAFSHMSGYHKVFSRKEIERVVEYIRSNALQPIEATIKTGD